MFGHLLRTKKQKVHFLHIGKTGGSAVKSVLKEFIETPKYILKLHGHAHTLYDVPKGDPVVFFLRDPVSRFVSGFYSRQRKGQPRIYSEWNPKEKKVFEHFMTPNEIAASLANDQSEDHSLALMAMIRVRHFKPYSKWYVNFNYFKSRLDDIFFVGFQESLDADFLELKNILEISQEILLPIGEVISHRNPKGIDKSICESGIAALREWYSDDLRFITLCKEIMFNKTNVHKC